MAVEFVDVSDIHLRDIRFEVTRADGRVANYSEMVSEFNWSDHVNTAGAEVSISCAGKVADILAIGGEGSSGRITAPLINLDTGLLVRRELWQGTFEEIVDNRAEGQIERYITGYDIAKFLATNEEDFVFTNPTLSSLVASICADFSVPLGTNTATTQTLGQIISRGRSLWELLQDAVQRHADLTGEVFRIYATGGRLNTRLQGDQSRYWVFESGESLMDMRRTRSVRDMINQIKVYGVFEGEADKPAVESVKSNETAKGLYGLRQRVEYIASAEDEARTLTMAQKTLDRFSVPEEIVEITGWLVPSLRAGEQVRFIDTEYGINRLYFVESIDTAWAPHRANTTATLRREAVDPDILLDEVTAV